MMTKCYFIYKKLGFFELFFILVWLNLVVELTPFNIVTANDVVYYNTLKEQ